MAEWLYEGGETGGEIVGSGGQRYPCRLEHGQVQVHLPFAVDHARLRKLLQRDGWAVAPQHETIDTQGWGPAPVADGYYPYWLRKGRGAGEAIFAFPPQDYRVGEGLVANPEDAARRADEATVQPRRQGAPDPPAAGWKKPVIGSGALEEFARWFPFLEASAQPQPAPPPASPHA